MSPIPSSFSLQGLVPYSEEAIITLVDGLDGEVFDGDGDGGGGGGRRREEFSGS